jgi:hypothetical protein
VVGFSMVVDRLCLVTVTEDQARDERKTGDIATRHCISQVSCRGNDNRVLQAMAFMHITSFSAVNVTPPPSRHAISAISTAKLQRPDTEGAVKLSYRHTFTCQRRSGAPERRVAYMFLV